MEVVRIISDFRDPSEFDGHGQIETDVVKCVECGMSDDLVMAEEDTSWGEDVDIYNILEGESDGSI